MNSVKILDKYIIKQLTETFLLGIIVFTSIMFASDTFINLVKQITNYGIPVKIAFLILILKLPSILVLTIPMGVLMATILTFNKLSLNSEIYVMRACRISLSRMALPVIIFGISVGFLSFFINEFVAPVANVQAKNLTILALSKKNIPDGKQHFSFKEMGENNQLKRLFYIDKSKNKQLEGITLLDMSRKGSVQVLQAKFGHSNPDYMTFNEGRTYTFTNTGKILNSTVFGSFNLQSGGSFLGDMKKNKASELNFFALTKYIQQKMKENAKITPLIIKLHEKIAIPLTAVFVAFIGIPLAITRPRAKMNRGMLFSILIIFCYYLLRAFSVSLGEAEIINPILSAWLPNIVIGIAGAVLFYRKAYRI